MKKDYNYHSIEEAAADTVFENMHPGGISSWSKDSEYMVYLFSTDRAKKSWGVSEGVYVDTREDVPYYIVTQYDGGIAAQTWYLDKVKLTFEEAEAYAREKSEELYQKYKGINKSNWKEYVKEKDGQ